MALDGVEGLPFEDIEWAKIFRRLAEEPLGMSHDQILDLTPAQAAIYTCDPDELGDERTFDSGGSAKAWFRSFQDRREQLVRELAGVTGNV